MIGVFDSGFGGLTVLKSFLSVLPEYDYIYLGDTARAPYGDKSREMIYDYTRQALDFLFAQGCNLVIIACNTISAEALRRLQQEYLPIAYPDKKVLGVIVPVVEEAVKSAEPIGVIGTRATTEIGAYRRELIKVSGKNDLRIFDQPCPLLVPLIEEGWIKTDVTKKILKKYLRPLKQQKINTLILGCTHYPLLSKAIKEIMGKKVKIIDSPEIVAIKLKGYLERHLEIDEKLSKNKKLLLFTTDNPERFKIQAQKFLSQKNIEVEKIKLITC